MEKFKTLSRFLILLFVTIAIALLAIGPVWAEEQEPYQSVIIARTEALAEYQFRNFRECHSGDYGPRPAGLYGRLRHG